ncbi:STAS domain-containing protein [Streptomyces sp. LP11]|uniref:STAS domain-containing protein n=1 Tax=Streptomyces pyxinicus TaxID=2970331 RepID=A0ABT2B3C2_9ACTN|nr:STAS domain-containing protein [Streptomyces sp. LP11]MCS0603025.1 STAS domain-containing protein [Streptomyces sp. LP11]
MQWESGTVVRVIRHERVFEVTVRGEMDYDESDLLGAAWDEADEHALPVTVVDLTLLTFGDSQLLRSLLDAHQRHRATDRAFVLLGPLHESVTRLLTISGTYDHFTITESRDAALRSAGG